MRTGLVMEGGALRGLYTAGVIDTFMEHGIDSAFDIAIGVSAGAAFGCNIKSKQPGRVLRYNKKYSSDPRYKGFLSFLLTGDFFGKSLAYDKIPNELDVFDCETYQNNPMAFYVVATDVVTGKAVYHSIPKGDAEDIEWIRASASMPLVSKIVEIGNRKLLDGGIADSIPLKRAIEMGCRKNVVVLTRPAGYVKEPNSQMPLLKAKYGKKYPHFVETLENRHIMYNEEVAYVEQIEKEGRCFVIRPYQPLEISPAETSPVKMTDIYIEGKRAALDCLEDLKKFLEIE